MQLSVSLAPRYPRAILSTALLPWNDEGRWDEALFRRTIRHLVHELTPNIYIFGTAGEGHSVSDAQFQAITRAFVDEMAAIGGLPMVGVISLSLQTVVDRIAWARDLGVKQFQISFPAWARLNDDEVDRFFAQTCGQFPELEFLHYNLGRAGRILTGADYARIASRHRNLVAIKMGGSDLAALTEAAEAAPMLRFFFTEFAYTALSDRTDCGLLCALGACAPALARRLFAADSAAQRSELEPVFRALHAAAKDALGGRAHLDGAYDKMYLKLHLPEFPLRLQPPYSYPDDTAFRQFQERCHTILSAPIFP